MGCMHMYLFSNVYWDWFPDSRYGPMVDTLAFIFVPAFLIQTFISISKKMDD